MKTLVWLASYPKSGNTWIRMFLAAYQKMPGDELQSDEAFKTTISDSKRQDFEQLVGRDGLSDRTCSSYVCKKALSHLKHIPSLKILVLCQPYSTTLVTALADCQQLDLIDFRGHKLTDSQLAALSAVLPKTRIATFD